MLTQRTEVRCPSCRKLLIGLSADFEGAVSVRCSRCKRDVMYPSNPWIPMSRINCQCGAWILSGSIIAGAVTVKCKRHKLVQVVAHADAPRIRVMPKLLPKQIEGRALVALIEDRWAVMRAAKVRKSVELAVGIRFDVFQRDGFRCRYCGRSPKEGVFLEADHVIPRSAGGSDDMSNLVTACWDCNRGKSAKGVDGERMTA